MKLIISFFVFLIMITGLVQASPSHFVVGIANDALDLTSANEYSVVLYNSTKGILDNVTDIVGPTGNSGANNIYLIDCELMQDPCKVGDILTVEILNNGSKYFAHKQNITVTGAGFDIAPNLTLNSPSFISSIIMEDDLIAPSAELDLTAFGTKQISCVSEITDLDGELDITSAKSIIYHISSTVEDPDDNNDHYSNLSCSVDTAYGDSTQALSNCTIQMQYYANDGSWTCNTTIVSFDMNITSRSNTSNVNQILAVDVPSTINYGTVNFSDVSSERTIEVINGGNVDLNIVLDGYGDTDGDGLAMNCSLGSTKSIPLDYIKFNLTNSNTGTLTVEEFENIYVNLTDQPTEYSFSLNQRQDDVLNDAKNNSYWRIYVPAGVAGTCNGFINFGATIA